MLFIFKYLQWKKIIVVLVVCSFTVDVVVQRVIHFVVEVVVVAPSSGSCNHLTRPGALILLTSWRLRHHLKISINTVPFLCKDLLWEGNTFISIKPLLLRGRILLSLENEFKSVCSSLKLDILVVV